MNIEDLNWQDLKLFLTVAESGSFSAAARVLRLGQPTLSRRIAELEERLGAPLFVRRSLGCELTSLGAKLRPAAEQMALWATEVVTQVQAPDSVHGSVRVTAPPAIAFALLPPFAARMQTLLPDVRLEVLSGIQTLNLARGEADLALRTRSPEDEDLICLATFAGSMKVYVAAQVAETLPDNVSIYDLQWICWPEDYDYLQINQILKQEIEHFQPAFTSDDYNVQIAACCCGLGAMVLPEGFDHNAVIKGLVALPIDLSHYTGGQLHIVAHKRQRYLPRVVKVVELLCDYFAEIWPDGRR